SYHAFVVMQAEEVEREKRLILQGKIPMEEAPKELADHPVLLISQITKKIAEERSIKKKTVLTSPNFYPSPATLSEDEEREGAIIMQERMAEGDLSLEDKLEEVEDPERKYMLTPEQYEKLKYESPLIKQLRNVEVSADQQDEYRAVSTRIKEKAWEVPDADDSSAMSCVSKIFQVRIGEEGEREEGALSIPRTHIGTRPYPPYAMRRAPRRSGDPSSGVRHGGLLSASSRYKGIVTSVLTDTSHASTDAGRTSVETLGPQLTSQELKQVFSAGASFTCISLSSTCGSSKTKRTITLVLSTTAVIWSLTQRGNDLWLRATGVEAGTVGLTTSHKGVTETDNLPQGCSMD
ncbi:unnamed protein product, partial [Timema podura]|nr:unnamed protein product [Timema podura]